MAKGVTHAALMQHNAEFCI